MRSSCGAARRPERFVAETAAAPASLLTPIDPSYEIKSDYTSVAETLTKAWKKCRHGVYLVWYPILTSGLQEQLVSALKGGEVRKVLRSEVMLDTPPERGMLAQVCWW